MWEVELVFDNAFFAVTRYGLIRGAKQESKKHCMIGRNFPTGWSEAEPFILSLWNKQKGKGYVESKDGEPQGIAPLPMLAHLFDKHKHKLIYPVIVQPKLDGFRCICIKERGVVSCWSRSGKRFDTTSLIEQELDYYMKDGDCFDGELYRHKQDFNKLSGSIRNVSEDASIAQYHIYDYIEEVLPQYMRIGKIQQLFSPDVKGIPKFQHVIQVPSLGAGDEDGVLGAATKFINDGYEGAIVRSLHNKYRPKYRSPQLLKVKEFMEEDFRIVDYFEGSGKDEGAVIWECETKEGRHFSARPRGTYEERRKFFQEGPQHIGSLLTVRFPKNVASKSKDGIPRFPVGIRIREEME